MDDEHRHLARRHEASGATWVQMAIAGAAVAVVVLVVLISVRHSGISLLAVLAGVAGLAAILTRDALDVAYAVETTSTHVRFVLPRDTVVTVPWTSVVAITGGGSRLARTTWRWQDGSCHTWTDLDDRRDLLHQASRMAPRLRALPG